MSFLPVDGRRIGMLTPSSNSVLEPYTAAMLAPLDLIAAFEAETGTSFEPGDVMMGGTLPAIGGVRAAARFSFSLTDPQTNARLAHGYDIEVLENVG